MSDLALLYEAHLRVQKQRTDAALEAAGFESLAIYAGAPHMRFLDDQAYPFKVNPHFKLWAPLLDAPESWILYQPAKPLRMVFLQPNDYWHQPPSLPTDFWTGHFAIEVIREGAQARPFVSSLPRCAFIGEWDPALADWGFAARNPEDLLHRLHYPRAAKTGYEIECMRRASKKGAQGHIAAERAFRAGRSEYDIHMDYLRASDQTENELPYSNIVALNEHAAVLHYQHQERRCPSQRRSFLIDAGAQFNGYASDITRTYSAKDDEFAALVRAMEELQIELCAGVRSGVDYSSIHLDAHRRIADVLRDSGVIKMSGEDAVASGLSGVFFPHGVGHLLGLQVHDVAGFSVNAEGRQKARPEGHSYLRLTRTLEPGVVVTIEPGLYFIDALLADARGSVHGKNIDWQQVERFRPYGGIRVEDNVVCTSGEPENLTRPQFAAVLSSAA
jgi:Xaa-Pro dipeptidase